MMIRMFQGLVGVAALSLCAIAPARPAEASDDARIPYSIAFQDGSTLAGMFRITEDDRVIGLDAFLLESSADPLSPGAVDPNLKSASHTWTEIQLASAGGDYALRGWRVSEKRIVLTGIALSDDAPLETFVSLLLPYEGGPAWFSFDAVTAGEVIEGIAAMEGEMMYDPDDPYWLCFDPGPKGDIVLIYRISPSLVIVVMRSASGGITVSVWARDMYGCWYLRTPIPGEGEGGGEVIIEEIRIPIFYRPIAPPVSPP